MLGEGKSWANEQRSRERNGEEVICFPAAYATRGSFAAKTYIRLQTIPPATQAISHFFMSCLCNQLLLVLLQGAAAYCVSIVLERFLH